MHLSSLPVRRIRVETDADPVAQEVAGQDPNPADQPPPPATPWYLAIPAVAQLTHDGWDLTAATVLVGENGAGKSTLVEALAGAFGMGAEGGSTGSRHSTRVSESGLGDRVVLERGAGASRRGFFLRAETMHSFYSYLEAHPGGDPTEPVFHEMSHGESFLSLMLSRTRKRGLYVLDEPESALSFTGCLALVSLLTDLVADGSQVVLSTHSPVLAALPGARIWEIGDWGMRTSAWDDLDLVQRWRGFLDAPERYLRQIGADG
ncbi:AAA family ATPase [Cellulomonas hominis]